MKLKKLFTKKTAIAVGGVALVLILVLCLNTVPPIVLRLMPAEQTVAYYFKQYNAKNLRGMQSVEYRDISNYRFEFPLLEYTRLISCEELSKEDAVRLFDQKWLNSHPVYDFTACSVVYEIQYLGGWSVWSGRHGAVFYLVKETKYSNWMIVMWGQA